MPELLRLLLIVLTAVTAIPAAAEAAVRAANLSVCRTAPVAGVPPSRLWALARGFNLPGWLEGPAVRRPDMRALAQLFSRGFTHIRLPVAPEGLLAEFSSPEDVARKLAELDLAVDSLAGTGFAVSIDMHPGGRFGRLQASEPERAFALAERLWRLLARRYADRAPERVLFEIMNEPAAKPAIWNEQAPRLVAAIRREARDHTIIYDHANYQRIDALPAAAPVADMNVVYAAHFYDPMIFTHQGLDWSEDPLRYLHQVPFPTRLTDPGVVRLMGELTLEGHGESIAAIRAALGEPWTEARINDAMGQAASWAQRHGRPVIINEFGALRWRTDPRDRARWLTAVRQAAEHNCLGWAHWDYVDGFGFADRVGDREIPDEMVLQALLGGATARSAAPAR